MYFLLGETHSRYVLLLKKEKNQDSILHHMQEI